MFALSAKDSYKVGHVFQYPSRTTQIYSNLTARSGKYSNVKSDGILYIPLFKKFAVDHLINEWNATFFDRPKASVLNKYQRRIKNLLGKEIDLEHISALHDLGYLPVRIKQLPEGSFVKYGVPCMTITNTLPEFYWVTNMLETVISCEFWQPITSATTYFYFRKLFREYAEETGVSTDFTAYQGHDFSMRGMPGRAAAAASGAAVLLAGSKGTDVLAAIDLVEDYYQADSDKEVVGESVDATEHSVMCAGSKDGEIDTLTRLLTEIYPVGPVSIVSDTWDFWKLVGEFLPALKETILNRDGKVIIRPDSGDPVDIICGTSSAVINIVTKDELNDFLVDADESSSFLFRFNNKTYRLEKRNRFIMDYGNDIYWQNCNFNNLRDNGLITDIFFEESGESKGLIECLWDTFGGTINEKGYKVLNPKIGAIYGDSINYDRAERILKRLKDKGFASSNIVFGLGSYSFQGVTRDTHGFAIKATQATINNESRPLFKDPKTDNGVKKSAKGYLMVTKVGNEYQLLENVDANQEKHGCLETVFLDGKLVKYESFSEIRERVESYY